MREGVALGSRGRGTNVSEREIVIDGSQGEGGGQILRTALALSLVTGRPFRIEAIRAGRKMPGLLRQHLTAVEAAAKVGSAAVEGAAIGSRTLAFSPGRISPGSYSFSVGTAGSATLVLQTVLPALLTAAGPSRLFLEGGTHNPFAPPFDSLDKAFLPLVSRMGPKVRAVLERPGFYPAGGGRFRVEVEPAPRLSRLDLLERGAVRRRLARAIVANLPRRIAQEELDAVRRGLSWDEASLSCEEAKGSPGPGNVVLLEIEAEQATEVFTGFGEKGRPAAAVAEGAIEEARRWLASDAPAGDHLADQLLLPVALAGGGSFRATGLTPHATTNVAVIRRFLDLPIETKREGTGAWIVRAG